MLFVAVVLFSSNGLELITAQEQSDNNAPFEGVVNMSASQTNAQLPQKLAGTSATATESSGALNVELAGQNGAGSPRVVAVHGDYAYVADGESGLRAADVSDPATPIQVGFYGSAGDANEIAVAGNDVYLADGGGGLLILRYTGGQIQRAFLPITILEPTPGPHVFTVGCYSFPQASAPDWYVQRCVNDATTYEIQRINVSHTQAWIQGFVWIDSFDHYSIEIDARLVQGDADYRIFFDEAAGGFYTFGVNPRPGTYSLMRVDTGDGETWVPLIDWTPSPHIRRDQEVNRLRVERNGKTIALSVNGHLLTQVQDGTYQDGTSWGLYTRNYELNSILHFNNMQTLGWE